MIDLFLGSNSIRGAPFLPPKNSAFKPIGLSHCVVPPRGLEVLGISPRSSPTSVFEDFGKSSLPFLMRHLGQGIKIEWHIWHTNRHDSKTRIFEK